ncbi:carbohydrate-binding protein [Paenibacillus sp. YPG26]|uniref:carbohydrate-binding protein n=1 Tax=Paenibacillus sp. YPG26 TaxID=2878915 RepID=UPI0020410125|nr:carbohydrate-binding protein [Paenibacillus sp. YPG26]USB33091.1 CBM21 domain-containing protein [Paenibacillus sp. YPG26]
MLGKMKKYLSGVAFLAIFALTFAQSAFASEQPAQLISANLYAYKYGYVAFSGNVEVSNLDYQKKVTIHYTPGDGKWYDTPASYQGPTDSTHEKWNFSVSTYSGDTTNPQLLNVQKVQFAIKYEVGGQTYWDNNNGQNYSVSRYNMSSTILGKPNVLKAFDSLSQNTFSGGVYLKNLDYTKTVKVRYTTDNWNTTKEGYASYYAPANSDGSVQEWHFSFNNIDSGVSQIKYAISYTVNGQTYWDNNYGSNYTVNR